MPAGPVLDRGNTTQNYTASLAAPVGRGHRPPGDKARPPRRGKAPAWLPSPRPSRARNKTASAQGKQCTHPRPGTGVAAGGQRQASLSLILSLLKENLPPSPGKPLLCLRRLTRRRHKLKGRALPNEPTASLARRIYCRYVHHGKPLLCLRKLTRRRHKLKGRTLPSGTLETYTADSDSNKVSGPGWRTSAE